MLYEVITVFRFDKPGAGRSAPGHYATERSNAIERAVVLARGRWIEREHLAHGALVQAQQVVLAEQDPAAFDARVSGQ